MKVQSEFMNENNALIQDLNKLWFDLKETNADLESDCFYFKRFQKDSIIFNDNESRYEVGLPLRNITRF